jgi:hypothetical protein
MQEKDGAKTQEGKSERPQDPRGKSIEGGTSVRDPSIDPPPPPPYEGPKGGSDQSGRH